MKLIPLTNGKFAKIDDEDFKVVSGIKFHAVENGNTTYARSNSVGYLHHFIAGKQKGLVVDHKDGDGLNNQKDNLQHITQSANIKKQKKGPRSSSGFRGVSHDRQRKCWIVVTTLYGKSVYLGRYKSRMVAALRFDRFTVEHYGTDCPLNFPDLF